MPREHRGETFAVTNPSTKETIRDLPIHSPEHVLDEMKRVREATPHWAATPIGERCERILRVAEVISQRMTEITETISKENGKVLIEALTHDVGPVLMVMNYFAKNATEILAPERIRLALLRHRRSYVSYQPKGVVGVITPWNFPFFMPGSDVAMSLIAGNGVLLKPSEITPLSALILKECYDEAGIDPNLFRVVTGLGATGAAVIKSHPDHVVFTGSVPTGRKVGMACAEEMIGYTLELGGKAPAIVLEDADIERTTNALLYGGFANNGQICASVERVYAMEGIYDDLIDQLTQKAEALTVGSPSAAAAVDLGAMTWPRQREVVEELIDDAKKKGARVTTGGERTDDPNGIFFRPTVVADCDHEMKIMRDEIFGPVVPIMKVRDEAEAIRLANESHLGLGGYVFTKNTDRGRVIAERLEVGSVMINDILTHAGAPEMPWGGIKESGLGVVRSDRGLRELCHARHINYDRIPPLRRDPYWFPYTENRKERVRDALKRLFGDSIGGKLLRSFLK